jgi:hypothetical protein
MTATTPSTALVPVQPTFAESERPAGGVLSRLAVHAVRLGAVRAPVIPLSGRVGELLGSGCGRWKRVLPGCWWSGSCLTAVISREHDDGAASRLAPQPLACVPRISR